jgi:signal transduction histidine kinase/HD-like signal output (HDOD) protein
MSESPPSIDAAPGVSSSAGREGHVELILRQIESLPTLAPVAMRLMRIGNLEDADLDHVVELIESDPPLTARLLGLCRRADKGLGDRITTIRRAVVMLGLEAVQSAALSVAVFEVMQSCSSRLDEQIAQQAGTIAGNETIFDRTGYWRHCVAVATASERIAEAHPHFGVRPEEAFVSGLLHDLGKLVLHVVLPRSYARVLGLAERRHCSSAQIESQVFGIDHRAAGRRIAEHWSLPSAIQDVIWLCGQPLDTLPDLPHRNLVALVGVARALCRHMHMGWCGDYNHPEPLDGPRGLCARTAFIAPLGAGEADTAGDALRGLDAASVQMCASTGPGGLHEAVLLRCRALGLGEQETPELLMQSLATANRRLGRLSADLRARSAACQSQAAALEGIAALHQRRSQPGQSAGIVEMLASVVVSARNALGAGFYATVHQARPGEAWQFSSFADDGRPARSHPIETPHDGGTGRCRALAEVGRAPATMSAMGAMPWLVDHLLEAEDVGRVQVLALTSSQSAGASAVLLHDSRPLEDPRAMQVLVASWSAAFAAAAQQESSRRLADQLASSNRQLSEAQARVSEMESMARLGEMAAGAAHEMNNPLAVISGRAEMLAEQMTDAGQKATARAIVEAAGRLTSLITAMDAIVNPPEPRLLPSRVSDLVARAIQMALQRTGSTVDVRTEPADGDAAAVLDPELIGTAIAELITNALEASPRGNICVRTQIGGVDRRLVVSVIDDGAGMSPRAQQHAFDPFFSECPAGRRTGLGLTRARRLAELHGGHIRLHSIAGQGTTATLEIPEIRSASHQPGTARAAQIDSGPHRAVHSLEAA